MDRIYASPSGPTRRDTTTTTHHHRQRRGRRHAWRTRSRGTRRADPRARARRLRAAGAGNWRPGGGLEASALPDDRALARRAAAGVPPVHALQRRRQHEVLGQRALPAAARGLRRRRARRRRLARLADRLRHAGAVLRSRRAALPGARRGAASIRPNRRAAPFPHPAVPHAAGHGRHRRAAAGRRACIPSPLPLGLLRPGEPGGCVLCNTCNSFPCRMHAKSDAEVCCVRPALARPERHALDERRRRDAADDRSPAAAGSRRSRSSATATPARVEARLVHRRRAAR